MNGAAFYQRGEALDYINHTETVIEAGTILIFGDKIGVAGTTIEPEEQGSIMVEGVYEMPKSATTEIEAGKNVYFDGTGITDTAGSATPAGYAAYTASADATTIYVKLNG